MMLFSDKLDYDHRSPIITFPLPLPWLSSRDNINLGLIIPSFGFWQQLTAIMIMQLLIGSLIALAVHTFIIKKRGSSSAFFIGYGVIIPFLLCLPYHIIKWLDIQNSVFMITAAGASALQAFRCITAIHGTTTPLSVEKKRFNYCIYFCSIVDLTYDVTTGDFVFVDQQQQQLQQQPRHPRHPQHPQRFQNAMIKMKTFLSSVFLLGLMYSIMELEQVQYKPFKDHENNLGIFNWKHLINNLCFAYIWHLCLLSGSSAFEFVVALITGIKTKPLTINPLFGSLSASDFWGRRWNNTVHKVLKDSVYRPLIPHFNPVFVVIAVFSVSGLLHEYVLFIADLSLSNTTSTIATTTGRQNPNVTYGLQTIFFLFNAGVLLCEQCMVSDMVTKSESQTIKSMIRVTSKLRLRLPRIIISLVVVMTVLPISHWFSQGMQEIPILLDYKLGYPMFVVVQAHTI